MASPLTHFIVGASIGWPAMEMAALRGALPRWAIPVTAGLWGVLPDLDTDGISPFNIPPETLFSHRGFFHSPFFLTLLAFIVAAIVVRRRAWLPLGALWSAAAVTHPLLDMLTDGGLGVTLLYPFSKERLFFPWRPIHVTPFDFVLFLDDASVILISELPFCAAAAALAIITRAVVHRRGSAHSFQS